MPDTNSSGGITPPQLSEELMWSVSSTNTIKRDSFKSKSSSGLNSLYATFNIQEPSRPHRDSEGDAKKKAAVFRLESLFGSSQNTFADDGSSIGTNASSTYTDTTSRKSDNSYTSRGKSRSQTMRKFSGNDKKHKRFTISSNSQTIHSVSLTRDYHSPMSSNSKRVPLSHSSASIGGPPTSLSLSRLQSTYDSDSVDNHELYDDLPHDLRSMASFSQENRRRNLDNVSVTTSYSSVWGNYGSAQYSRKWRVGIAVLVGGILIALCLLGFYLNVESRRSAEFQTWSGQKESCNIKRGICPRSYSNKTVLLIAIDSLRYDMITPDESPTLHYLSQCGVRADHLTPVYPSYTFPNMYSIVTGLYPESHGIIGNDIKDPVNGEVFRPRRRGHDKKKWWQGEPLWITMKQKQSMRSAVYAWPGSEVVYDSAGRPDYSYKYREKDRLELAINTVLGWLALEPEERPQFLALYIDRLDKAAKELGVGAIPAALQNVDRQLDRLMMTLDEKNLTSCVDIIVVSGHGITSATDSTQSIFLEKFWPDNKPDRFVAGAVGRLQAAKGREDELLESLRCRTDQLRVLTADNLPIRYHYTNSPRIENIILDTCLGCRILSLNNGLPKQRAMAEQGYNNIEEQMQGIFIARGPSFQTERRIKGFRNIEIYNLITEILNLEPADNNGTDGSLLDILRDPPSKIPHKEKSAFIEIIMPLLHPHVRNETFLEEARRELATTATTTSPTTTTTRRTSPSSTVNGSTPVPTIVTSTETSAASTPSSTTVSSEEPSPSTSAPSSSTQEATASSVSTIPPTSTPTTSESSAASTQPSSPTTSPSTASVPPVDGPSMNETASSTLSSAEQEALIPTPNEKVQDAAQNVAEMNREGKTSDSLPDPSIEKDVVQEAKGLQEAPKVIVEINETNNSDDSSAVSDISKDSAVVTTSQTTTSASTTGETSAENTPSTVATTISIQNQTNPPVMTPTTENSPTIEITSIKVTTESTTESRNTSDVQSDAEIEETTMSSDTADNIADPEEAVNATVLRKRRDTTACAVTDVLANKNTERVSEDHINFHCPFGRPWFAPSTSYVGTHYVLPFSNHVTGYIGELGTALWTSFTITNDTLSQLYEAEAFSRTQREDRHWLADPRLPRSTEEQCSEYLKESKYNTDKVVMLPLHPRELEFQETEQKEGFFLTNAIALYKTFASGCHVEIIELIISLVEEKEQVNVVIGPAWLRNYDNNEDYWIQIRRRSDYLLPTHVFYLVSYCTKDGNTDLRYCPLDQLEVFTIIMPNIDYEDNCFMTCEDYAQYHLATVADLQTITNLLFFKQHLGEPKRASLVARQPLKLWTTD